MLATHSKDVHPDGCYTETWDYGDYAIVQEVERERVEYSDEVYLAPQYAIITAPEGSPYADDIAVLFQQVFYLSEEEQGIYSSTPADLAKAYAKQMVERWGN